MNVKDVRVAIEVWIDGELYMTHYSKVNDIPTFLEEVSKHENWEVGEMFLASCMGQRLDKI